MISKKIILMAVAILFFSSTVFSKASDAADTVKQVEFDINGMKLGDKLTKDFFDQYCPHRFKNSETIECKQSLILNEVKLSILYFFYNTRLLAISIRYPSSKYEKLINTYTSKFSKSPLNEEEPILLSTGVKYTNKKSSWNTMSGLFTIEEYGNNFKYGVAYLKSDEYKNYKIKKSEDVNAGFMQKLFGDIVE